MSVEFALSIWYAVVGYALGLLIGFVIMGVLILGGVV